MRLLTAFAVACLLVLPLTATAQEKKDAHGHDAESPKRAVCVLIPMQGNKAKGVLTLTAGDGFVQITGVVEGLEPGDHGFHIHELGDISSADGMSAGPHYNPDGHKHGGPDSKERHAGDLGNINAKQDGKADVMIKAKGVKLHFILGRSLVVHAKADDLKTDPSGESGGRIAVGVIGLASDKAKTPAPAPKAGK